MSDLTARLRRLIEVAAQDPSWVGRGVTMFDSLITKAADRIVELEAEVAALEFDVAALDELNSTLEAECEALEAENARLLTAFDAHQTICPDTRIGWYHFVKPGQAVRPDGVVCDLVEATDETAAFDVSHVIDRITRNRAWILRPVALPEGGTR